MYWAFPSTPANPSRLCKNSAKPPPANSGETALSLCLRLGNLVEKQQAEVKAAFSERLRKAAKEVVFLGGAFHWGKMNFVERFIIKRITGRKGDMDMIRHKAIKKFARSMIEA